MKEQISSVKNRSKVSSWEGGMAIVGPTLCVKGAISIGDSVVLQLPLFDGACVEMARGRRFPAGKVEWPL